MEPVGLITLSYSHLDRQGQLLGRYYRIVKVSYIIYTSRIVKVSYIIYTSRIVKVSYLEWHIAGSLRELYRPPEISRPFKLEGLLLWRS